MNHFLFVLVLFIFFLLFSFKWVACDMSNKFVLSNSFKEALNQETKNATLVISFLRGATKMLLLVLVLSAVCYGLHISLLVMMGTSSSWLRIVDVIFIFLALTICIVGCLLIVMKELNRFLSFKQLLDDHSDELADNTFCMRHVENSKSIASLVIPVSILTCCALHVGELFFALEMLQIVSNSATVAAMISMVCLAIVTDVAVFIFAVIQLCKCASKQ